MICTRKIRLRFHSKKTNIFMFYDESDATGRIIMLAYELL